MSSDDDFRSDKTRISTSDQGYWEHEEVISPKRRRNRAVIGYFLCGLGGFGMYATLQAIEQGNFLAIAFCILWTLLTLAAGATRILQGVFGKRSTPPTDARHDWSLDPLSGDGED